MRYIWQDLPERKNCFTIRNAAMINLNTGEIIRHYSANTKIVVVQKCVTPDCTYYRTQDAAHHYLNHAFEASAFGLPNEVAPLVPTGDSHPNNSKKQLKNTPHTTVKNKNNATSVSAESGEPRWAKKIIHKLFRRKNG